MDYFKKAVKDAVSDIKPAIKLFEKKSKKAFNEIENKIINKKIPVDKIMVPISDRVFWMPFPEKEQIPELANYLNNKYDNNYFIWNVSEHKYQVFPFYNQVVDHNFPGYPSPPLSEIFLICKAMLNWLQMDDKNIVIIHCQNTRGRSALILSCLLVLLKEFSHPGEALTYFCKQTRTKDQKILFPSQQLYLNYFANIMNGLKLNTKPAKIQKIVFSEVPRIIQKNSKNNSTEEEESFRPYCQLFKDSKIIFNSLNDNKILSYYETDMSLWFDMQGLEIQEDVLLRCKHYQTNEERIPIFRMMIQTNFIHDNILRLLKKDIDFTQNVEVSDNFFIDIIFYDQNQTKVNINNTNSNKDGDDDVQDEEQKDQNESDQQNNNKQQLQQNMNNLEYIAKQLKKQCGLEQNEGSKINKLIMDPIIGMGMSRKSSSSNSEKDSPVQNKFSIVDDSRKTSEDMSSSDHEKHVGDEDEDDEKEDEIKQGEEQSIVKDEKLDKFLNKLEEDEDDQEEDEDDMDDYLANLENQE